MSHYSLLEIHVELHSHFHLWRPVPSPSFHTRRDGIKLNLFRGQVQSPPEVSRYTYIILMQPCTSYVFTDDGDGDTIKLGEN